ncbi:MAG: LuxR C-terminal-related transcriptional regulator [Candidatus Micrarchaeota archaeon]
MDAVRVRRVYLEFSKHHGLKPVVLKEIVFLRAKGYSNVGIASELGVSRNTVAAYLGRMRAMQDADVAEMMSLVGLMLNRRRALEREIFGNRPNGV